MSMEEEVWVTPTMLETGEADSLDITADRYQVAMDTDMDAHACASLIAHHETGGDTYELKKGADWAEAGPRERVVTDEEPLEEDEDVVYIRQEGKHGRYARAYFAPDDRDPAQVTVTVEQEHGSYPVAPLHDALAPFMDDAALLDTVGAVEDALDRYEQGELDTVRI